jgi:LCP family protein required for cell wall assembly
MSYSNKQGYQRHTEYVRQPKKKRSCLTTFLILLPFMVIFGFIAAISLNVVRNKQPRYTTVKEDQQSGEVGSQPVEIPNRVITYLLLGSDYRPDEGTHTDVIILASVNFKEGKVNLLSFPRDLWVTIPGWEENRINAAYLYDGIELLYDTLEYNFGIRPDHYAMVNFEGFVKTIDALGGIDVNAEIAMEDYCTFNEARWCRVEPGITHMDGTTALWYARARYNTSDFDRTRRAQEVIKALVKKSVSFEGMIKSGKLFNTLGSYVETDMTSSDLLPLIAKMGSFTADGAITSYRITENEAYSYTTYSGANVLIPDFDAIRLIIDQVLWISTP